jgi:hypothetical protein
MNKVLIVIIISVVLMVGLVFWALAYSPMQKEVTSTEKVSLEDKEYQGNYFSFVYPWNYRLKEESDEESKHLEKVTLISEDNPRRIMIIKISQEEETVNDITVVPSVQLRQDKSNQYDNGQFIHFHDQTGLLFTRDQEKFEKVIFFYKDHLLTTISGYTEFNTEDNRNTLNDDYQIILESFQWK